MRTYSNQGSYMNNVEDLAKFIEAKIRDIDLMRYDLASKERNIESLKREKVNWEEHKANLLRRMSLR